MDLFRFWNVLRTHVLWIVVVTFVVMVGTYLSVRRLPKIYAATARIVIPQRGSSGASFLPSSLGRGDLAGLVAGSMGLQVTGSMDLFIAYLESRTMAEGVVAHFDIQRRFNIPETQRAVGFVMGMGEFIPKKTGTLDIRVESPDPRFAADMANFYADNLDRMNRTYSITDAGRNRGFIEARLAETQKALGEAEERMRQFEERNKALAGASTDYGSKSSLDTVTRLQGELWLQEALLASMRGYATDDNPDLIVQKLRIEEARRQLEDVQYGNHGSPQGRKTRGKNPDQSFSLPVAELPTTLLEGMRLRRELKLQEAVFALLSSQLEQAKIAEARDLPTLQILDRAIPPIYPVKPNVRKTVLFNSLLTFVVAFLGAFGWDAIRRLKGQALPDEPVAG